MGLKDWWNDIKKKAFKKSARIAAEKAADNALDDLESALLGKVGAADQILDEQSEVDPLDRIRAAHGLTPEEKPNTPKSDPLADAQAQLAALKAEREKNGS